jgi:hypothetical protein
MTVLPPLLTSRCNRSNSSPSTRPQIEGQFPKILDSTYNRCAFFGDQDQPPRRAVGLARERFIGSEHQGESGAFRIRETKDFCNLPSSARDYKCLGR